MKIVREHIDESFTRDSEDKLKSVGVGKKQLIEDWLDENRFVFEDAKVIIDDKLNVVINKPQLIRTLIHNINVFLEPPEYVKYVFKGALNTLNFARKLVGIQSGFRHQYDKYITLAIDMYRRENIKVPEKYQDAIKLAESLGLYNFTSSRQ
jgi:hypothetical protein